MRGTPTQPCCAVDTSLRCMIGRTHKTTAIAASLWVCMHRTQTHTPAGVRRCASTHSVPVLPTHSHRSYAHAHAPCRRPNQLATLRELESKVDLGRVSSFCACADDAAATSRWLRNVPVELAASSRRWQGFNAVAAIVAGKGPTSIISSSSGGCCIVAPVDCAPTTRQLHWEQ